MSYNAKSWSNPINLDANNLNRLEQGIKNSHDTLEILNEEVSNLQLRYKNTALKINLLVKDSPNILETLNSIQSTIKNNDVNSILSSMDSFLMKSKQSLTDNELVQVYSNLKLNTFLRLDSIKVNGENVVEGSTVNIELPKVDEHLDINSNNAISNRAVAEALDKLKTLKPSGSNTNTNISGLADWALQPNKPQYYFSEILGKPDLITKTEAHKYTDDIFSALVNGAPETLDTLKEISDWIATDEYGTTALINRVSSIEQNYLPLTGGTLTGQLINNNSIRYNWSQDQYTAPTDGTRYKVTEWFYDKNNKNIGVRQMSQDTNNIIAHTLDVRRDVGNTGKNTHYASISVCMKPDGTSYAKAPNPASNSNTNDIATTKWVKDRTDTFLSLAGGTLTGDLNMESQIKFPNDISTDNTSSWIYVCKGGNAKNGFAATNLTSLGSRINASKDGDGNVIKDTYTKLDGSNYYIKLSQPSDNGNAIGFRHIATCYIGNWSHKALSLIIKSRHSGTGLLTIGIAAHGSLTNNLVGSIRFYGSTDASIKANSWKMVCDTTSGDVKLYWRYWDGDYCEIKVLNNNGFTTLWNDGEWLTTEPTAGEGQVEYLTVRYDKEYLPLTGGTLTGEITIGQGDGNGIQLGKNGVINATSSSGLTNRTVLGLLTEDNLTIGNGSFNTLLRGKQTNPTYNGVNLALITDNVASATKATQDGNGNVITSKYTTLDTTQTISGQKTFSKAPYFTDGINRYSLSPVADITKTATNTTWHHQYEDYLDTNGKRLGVIGSVQTGDGYYGVYLQGGNESSLNVLTDGTNGRITTNNVLHLSRANDASNDYTKEPALVIGSKTGSRLHIDNNEIQAFNGAATANKPYPVTWLGLNKQGGDIGFATNSGGGMNFQPKIGLIPSVTNQLSLGNSTYGFKDIHIKGALYFD